MLFLASLPIFASNHSASVYLFMSTFHSIELRRRIIIIVASYHIVAELN
jgi:hypothetical protein